jgi:hypothetical protein
MTNSSLRETLLSVRQRAAIMRDSLYGPTRQIGREMLEIIDHGLASKPCKSPTSRFFKRVLTSKRLAANCKSLPVGRRQHPT